MAVARGLFGYDGYIELNAFTIGAIALGTVSGAYSTEVIRGAVLVVPKGQLEAARACGMSGWLLFRRILVPQIARYALPGLRSEEHTSELQSLMRISYAVFCLKNKKDRNKNKKRR